MSSLMYSLTVPLFVRTLGQLSGILDKAAAFAEAKKFDPAVLLNSRLAPDMFPLTRQVQICCDFAKGPVARLAGVDVPKYDDNEASLEDLKARIAKTLAYVQSFKPEQFDGSDTRNIQLNVRNEAITLVGLPYLIHMALPNFFFHATTAYNILRHNGVEIGKRDFTGPIG